ncbi:MAG: ABC-2 family transporter protein [Nanoarchaeota archaeon]
MATESIVRTDTGDFASAFRKYFAVMAIHWKESMHYFMEKVFSSFFVTLVILIFYSIYKGIFAMQGQEVVMGFTLNSIVWYFLVCQLVRGSGMAGVVEDITEDVQTGNIAYQMCRPYSYLLFTYWKNMGNCVWNLAVKGFGGALMALFLVGLPSDPGSIFPVIISMLLGTTIYFMMVAMIGLMSFWFEEVRGFLWIYDKFQMILGGLFAPIDIFPAAVKGVISVLPFAYMMYAPGKLFTGFSWSLFGRTILGQVAWIAILSVPLAIEYRLISKKLSVAGG